MACLTLALLLHAESSITLPKLELGGPHGAQESALKKRGRDEGPEEEEGAPVTAKRAKDIKKTRAERRFEEAAGITHIDEGAEAEEDMGQVSAPVGMPDRRR